MIKTAIYMTEVERLLKQHYGITLEDAGLCAEEWLDRFGDESALDAIEAFATKYDLTPLSAVTFMPS
jgi:hypothetical protein